MRPTSGIDEAERRAIEREHPLYNKTYNGRWRVEFEVAGSFEFRAASREEIAARLAVVVAAGMAAVWLFDTVANWSVRGRATPEVPTWSSSAGPKRSARSTRPGRTMASRVPWFCATAGRRGGSGNLRR